MWSQMMSWQYEIFCRQNRARGNHEEAAFESLPLARAGRAWPLRRALAWLKRQLAAGEALRQELDSPTAGQHSIPSGKPIGEVL
jgi:hypothetical protein